MNTLSKSLSMAALVFTVMAARAATVTTDYDHSANFSSYHSFSFGTVTTSNPLFESRVKHNIGQELQAKGWQLMPSGGAVTVVVTGNVKNEQQLETMYDGMGGGWGSGWGWGGWGGFGNGGGFGDSTTTTTEQPVGKLVVDLLDASNKKLLFRGISSGDTSSNASKNTKDMSKDVDKMFKKFPPK